MISKLRVRSRTCLWLSLVSAMLGSSQVQ